MSEWDYPWPGTPTALPSGSVTVTVTDAGGRPLAGVLVTLALAQPWPRAPQRDLYDVPADGVWLDTDPHPLQGIGWRRTVELDPTAAANSWTWTGPSGTYRGTFTTL